MTVALTARVHVTPGVHLHAVADRPTHEERSSSSVPAFDELTRTQAQILELIAQGFTNQRIAEVRGIDKKTVEMHIKRIYQALGIEVTAHQNARVLAALRFVQAEIDPR